MRAAIFSSTVMLLLLASGCNLAPLSQLENELPFTPPSQYYVDAIAVADQPFGGDPWWLQYENQGLNEVVSASFQSNFSLRAAWARLAGARAQLTIDGAGQYPYISIWGDAQRFRQQSSAEGGGATGTQYSNWFFLNPHLSYEVDVWGRVEAIRKSAEAHYQASRADLETTALVLSGTIADLWFAACEERAQIRLLSKQRALSKTLLELTELRFSVGKGSALDVYQQRQQYSSVDNELPLRKGNLQQILNSLAVLKGATPGTVKEDTIPADLPELPPFPSLVSPGMLLVSRPDLRAARYRLEGAEHAIAAAIAERFPKLGVTLSYEFQAAQIAKIFDNELLRMAMNVTLPITDGGSLRAQVRQRKAAAKALQLRLGNNYLEALRDVENAIIAERYQKKRLKGLRERIQIARDTLRESRKRYVNGRTDYVDVVLAIQSLQHLEREDITARRELLNVRNKLYLAIGGLWTATIVEET